jgi:hypothetical protein
MCFRDGAIDARGEPEIVGVDDQPSHEISVARQRGGNFW